MRLATVVSTDPLEVLRRGEVTPMPVAYPEAAVYNEGDTVRSWLFEAEAVISAPLGPTGWLTADDTLTTHSGHAVTVAAASYHTIFDLSAATDLIGGMAYGVSAGLRLTIDGQVVIDATAARRGRDSSGDAYGPVLVPPARAVESMKLELHNALGSPGDYGWRVWTR